ncbi:hypothetical protein ACJMK2_044343 [Sinanodonta woodiana]|uniref:DZIP3-like HEPN domain-containing protein n=1 Tax=Sinanodonta woodiana TaxID=1069815 RepID=A0ABD3W2N7_SINWO
MAAQSVHPEKTRYARLCLAFNDECTKCLRDVLLRNVASQDIRRAIGKRWGYQYNQPDFHKYPFCVLFPNRQLDPNFSVSNCDMSLLYVLKQSVSLVQQPSSGWGKRVMNDPKDTSIGANVERLHQLRNTVIHLPEPSVSKQEFNSYWTKIRNCLVAIDKYLGGISYQQKLEILKTADMDPENENRIVEKFRSSEQAKLLEQLEQTLSDDIKTSGDRMFKELKEVKFLIKSELQPITSKVNLIHERMEGKANENDQTKPQLNSDQGERTVNTTSNQDTNGGNKIGDLTSGLDGKLCITKQYAFIKSHLTKESGLAIAKYILDQKLLSQDAYDEMGNTSCARRHLIDKLLKKVIHGSEEEIVEAFFKRLKVECPSIARVVKETTITEVDRSRFAQFDPCGRKLGFSFGILWPGNSQHDVNFFKYHLCASKEVVEYIADVMLSRLYFSILDHCSILDYPRSEDMISALFKKMHLYNLDVVSELKGVVELSLYQTWMEFRSAQGSRFSRLYRWMINSKSVIDDSFKSEEIELKKRMNFSVDLLKPESLKNKIKTLLERGCLESKTEPMSIAQTTVYIESSPNEEDREEIHIYIDFHATDVSIEAEDHQAELRIRNRGIMLEEMNPERLKKWILDQPCIEKTHRDMLESKLSEQGLLGQDEMTVLLDFINGLENGDHLLEKYCETNDPYVYNKVFGKHQESISQQEEIPGHRAAVTYVKGGGLQKLFSFSIIFNDEGKIK